MPTPTASSGRRWATKRWTPTRVSRVLDLIRFWNPDEKPVFDSAAAAGAQLREVLAGRRVLLVVDDVWSSADVEPFRGLDAGSALLITTRNRQTLPSECRGVDVDAMLRDGGVLSVAVLGENHVVSASYDKTLRVWDVESGETLRTLQGHTGRVLSVAVLGENGGVQRRPGRAVRCNE